MQTATMDVKRLFFFAYLQRNINCQFQIETHALNCKTKGNGKVKNRSAKRETELRDKNEIVEIQVGNYMWKSSIWLRKYPA